jgi:RNA-directed DNA polymerase
VQGQGRRQRQRANTQGAALQVAWPGSPGQNVQRQVCRLQQRMDRATPRGEVSTGPTLQKLRARSWDARLLAGRRSTQAHRGRPTAGSDGIQSCPPPQRWRGANALGLDDTARSLRRLGRPTRGSTTDNRPLGMPTQAERARPPRVRQALEPAWAAKLAAPTSGFRPGRSCHEALGASCPARRYRPPEALHIDRAPGCARIAHPAVGAKGQAPPRRRRPRTAWRQAGSLEDAHRRPTPAGPPQGGSGAPRLALLALHGRAAASTQVDPHARVRTSAADGVGLPEDRQGLAHAQELRTPWWAQGGLRLHAAKSSRRQTWEGAHPGVPFLGGARRQSRVGQPPAGQGPRGHRRRGAHTLSTPATAQVQDQLAERGRRLTRGRALPQGLVRRPLHPTSRGGATDDRPGVRHAVSGRLDQRPWITLRSWARWRPPRQAIGGVTRRSWQRWGARLPWATTATAPHAASLRAHSAVRMTRHVNVQGHRSPYEGDWVSGSTRQGRPPTLSATRAWVLTTPQGRGRDGGLGFPHDDRIEVDHIHGKHRKARSANLQALHGPCHQAKTREPRDDLPPGMRDKHQATEERREAKVSCAALEQW